MLHLLSSFQIITNKILVRGIFNSITLAVIGHEIENFPVKNPPPKADAAVDEDLRLDTSPGSDQEEKFQDEWDDDDYDEEGSVLYDDDEYSQDGDQGGSRQDIESYIGGKETVLVLCSNDMM